MFLIEKQKRRSRGSFLSPLMKSTAHHPGLTEISRVTQSQIVRTSTYTDACNQTYVHTMHIYARAVSQLLYSGTKNKVLESFSLRSVKLTDVAGERQRSFPNKTPVALHFSLSDNWSKPAILRTVIRISSTQLSLAQLVNPSGCNTAECVCVYVLFLFCHHYIVCT